MNNINERLKQIRQNLGFSQQKLADKLGIQRNIIGDIERGKVKKPNFNLLRKLEEIYDINPDWLLTGEKEMYKKESAKNIKQEITEVENNNINTSTEDLPADIQIIVEELLEMDKTKRKKFLRSILSMEE
jgi:transcriptional regulator with XRE-family HTH domain